MSLHVDQNRSVRHVRRLPVGLLGALLVLSSLSPQCRVLAQSTGYLVGQEIDFHSLLGPPPPADSRWDRSDEQLVQAYQSVDEARWKMAELDQLQLYPRFTEALGRPIDSKTSPALVALLDRALLDVDATAAAAKDYFHRPRPPQRIQLSRVCGKDNAPKPEEHPMSGASYPSGHSTRGWTVAMILARVAPDRAEALMKRAQEYEESRLICGMHFPTDVEAGQVVATAVVAHLDASRAFQTDLLSARREYASGVGQPRP
jgi:acid phosphatase (class A)